MRPGFVVMVMALGLAGCAGPVRNPAVVSLDGEFRGPVVAQRGVPISARYQGMCESPAKRWHRGYYRTYDCSGKPVTAVVRAKY